MMNIALTIALRYVFARKKSFPSIISIISIAISTAIIIATYTISTSLRQEMTRKILGFSGHLSIFHTSGKIEDNYEDEIEDIKNLLTSSSVNKNIFNHRFVKTSDKGMKGLKIFPTIKKQIVISSTISTGAILYGVEEEDIKNRPLISDSVSEETLKNFTKDDSIIVGKEMLDFLGVSVGDKIMVMCPTMNTVNMADLQYKIKYLKIAGTFDAKIKEYNSSFAFIRLDTAQDMFSMYDEINEFEIFINDPDNTTVLKERLNKYLKNGLICSDWKEINKSILETINMEKIVMFIIFLFIILTTAIGIVGSIINLAQKKRREIAILRTIGATKFTLVITFLLVAKIISIIGLLIGVLLGIVLVKNIQFLSRVANIFFNIENISEIFCTAPQMNFYHTFLICLSIFFIVSLIVLYPSYRAASIAPADALKED